MINLNQTFIGIELGSTRIKAVMIDEAFNPIASGSYDWENELVNGIWTYSLEEIEQGLQKCFKSLKREVQEKYSVPLSTTGAIGISAMMHGYLPLDENGVFLTEFRTWRNTITGEAAQRLTQAFDFNIPQRWSIAHLYQAILNNEEHISKIKHITTLAGYIHWRLTGVHALGVGDASGMFPIDSEIKDYNKRMLSIFDTLSGQEWTINSILPKVLCAGEEAGRLTKEGAAFLDPDGDLLPGIPFAPCEGDAGTGMAATNSVKLKTGNVSAGTSDFAMIVTDKPMHVHREIDMVTTPSGYPVAMVHCNNCTSDINAWAGLFEEFANQLGLQITKDQLFNVLFKSASKNNFNCKGLIAYNYFSGEGVTDIDAGRPVFARTPDAPFSLSSFMAANLFSALATLKIGLDILINEEKVEINTLFGHGGFFKVEEVGQRVLSAAVRSPVSVMETAGEGGPYGMALLAAYQQKKNNNESLEEFLEEKVFSETPSKTVMASEEEIEAFSDYVNSYKCGFPIESAALNCL